jgi:hypothetical protein
MVDIGMKYGCDRKTVWAILYKNNIPLKPISDVKRGRRIKDQKLTDDDLKEAIRLYKCGESVVDICSKYDITPGGLRGKLMKHGVTLRTKSESALISSTVEKRKKTNLEKLGVEYPPQNPTVFRKRYKYNKCIINGKEFTHLQGFEERGIHYMISNLNITVDQIEAGQNIPNIYYQLDNKKKIYYPDFFIPDKNLLIEIKCEFTYRNQKKMCDLKHQACKDSGYNILTIIFNNRGTDVFKILD